MCVLLGECCCCISLEIGTRIISIISLISSAFLSLLYGSAAALLSLSPFRAWMYCMQATNAGLHLVACCMLVYGAFTNRRRWLQPWVVVVMMSSAALMLLSVTGVAAMMLSGRADPTVSLVVSAYACYALTEYYLASVVWSRHQQLLHQTEGSESNHTLLNKGHHV